MYCGVGSLLWGPKPGEELRMFLSEISTATKSEAAPALITVTEEGGRLG